MAVLEYRPIRRWPGDLRPEHERKGAQFRSTFERTLSDLEDELERIEGEHAVVQLAVGESDIRLDGQLKARAHPPHHPGVIVAFDSMYGPQQHYTDAFITWQDNLRAVTLGLVALRAIDRYGLGRGGEQYKGYLELTSGGPDPARGRALIDRHGSLAAALRATHPDTGGRTASAADFADVQAAREQSR